MNNTINMAIQILPSSKDVHPYKIIDEAIDLIKQSGLKYRVCPFETVVEGKYDDLSNLIKNIHAKCYAAGAGSIIANIKIQSKKDEDVFIEDKMLKYDNDN